MNLLDTMTHDYEKDGAVKDSGIRSSGNFIFRIPGKDTPIIFKLINPMVLGIQSKYIPIDYFVHKTGNGNKDKGTHPSRKSLGLGDSPELEFFYQINDTCKSYYESQKVIHGNETSTFLKSDNEWQRLQELRKAFSPKKNGYILVTLPGDPQIKAVKVSKSVIDRLFGAEAYGTRPEIPSVISELDRLKLSPYLTPNKELNSRGWLRMYKEGEGLDTKYHVLHHTSEKVNDDGSMTTISVSADVHDSIYTMGPDDVASIPNPIEQEKNNVWTLEESRAFVEAQGSITGTPDRYIRQKGNTGSSSVDTSAYTAPTTVSDTTESTDKAVTANITFDDIPF